MGAVPALGTRPLPAATPDHTSRLSPTKSRAAAEMKRALKITERIMNQNFYLNIYSDYKYWQDDVEGTHATVLPLWRMYHSKTLRKQVTSICWNPRYRDLFAAGYGSYDFQKNITRGVICVFSLKNPNHPEYTFDTPSEVMCLKFHQQSPALLAVGLYNGTVMVYDIRIKGEKNNPIYQSTVRTKKHTDPVWEVRWNKKEPNREMSFHSISSDGRITRWTLMKVFALHYMVEQTGARGRNQAQDGRPSRAEGRSQGRPGRRDGPERLCRRDVLQLQQVQRPPLPGRH
jgi:hypothetical protein